ncbi:MAG: hypothetical protein CMH30_06135 [Micavibrio sp.]|mgnify:CR=1 FL=1|nr:hypothetical protein [Micavibrio sp.]|tara:strand:- start:561 stop:743 length:183 start_codon:yes stop_codon:yes gene_type:complete
MEQKNISYRDIEALVDGALDADSKSDVEEAIEKDVHLQKFYFALQEQKALLQKWWRYSET